MRSLIFGLLALLNSWTAFAQQYSIRNYTTANGLINNRTHTINQDALGYIWIGTDNGICRFDGKNFKYFFLPGIKKYYFTPCTKRYKQYVLFSTSFGVSLCCGDSVISFNPKKAPFFYPVESFPLSDTSFLLTDSRKGLFKIEKNSFSKINLPASISEKTYPLVLHPDKAGNLWLGMSTSTIVFLKGDFSRPVFIHALDGIYINAIKSDSQGNLFIVSDHGLLRVKAGELRNPENVIPEKLFNSQGNNLSAVAFDKAGYTWLTSTLGAIKFNNDFTSYTQITPENGVASNYLWDAFCDRENNMWFATENGVSKLSNNSVINYRYPANEFPNIKSGVVWDDSVFYYTNGNSLNKLVGEKSFSLDGFLDITGYLEERMIKLSGNRILINKNTNSNLIAYKVTTREFYVYDTRVSEVPGSESKWNRYGSINMESVSVDKQGNIWCGSDTAHQLMVIRNNKLFRLSLRDQSGKEMYVHATCRDNHGNLWLSGSSQIVQCAVSPAGDSFSIKPLRWLGIADGLNMQEYYKIFADSKNRVWSGGRDGALIRIDLNADQKIRHIQRFEPPEISGLRVTDFMEAANGDIWVGTNAGIDIISTLPSGKINIQKDAYSNDLCGKFIYFLKKQGSKVYIGTTGCMAVITPDPAKISIPAPLVFINDIRTGNSLNNQFLSEKNYALPPDSNTISFSFISTTFLNEPVQYRYMLEGIDKAPGNFSEADNITYTQLPPGTYTFKVWARNGDGKESLQPAVKTFTIRTPFYHTWWFYLLCVIIFAGSMYALFNYRLKQNRKLDSIRRNISNDLHDDIGSTLSSITMMSSFLKQKIESDPEKAASLATNIEESGRQMIYAMSDIVWSIKPGNDTPEQIINRLREYMTIMLEPVMDDYKLTAGGNYNGRNLSMYLRRDIYLICKEIIHNTAKYSQATSFKMNVQIDGNRFILKTLDNGKGFDFVKGRRGNGLNNILQRIANYKGTADCKTDIEKGTEWNIIIPL